MRPALLVFAVLLAAGLGAVRAESLKPIRLVARAGHVKKGSEKQTCFHETVPGKDTIDVNHVQIFVHGGSHHVHLYRPVSAASVYPPRDCPFAVDFSQWELVAATQTENLDWQLHPGVGIEFLGHQPLLIQTHFVNTGSGNASLSVSGNARAKMILHPMAQSTVTAHGGALFAQDRTVSVPPGLSTASSGCELTGNASDNREMTVMALTGHYHFRGIRFEVWRTLADGTRGELVYLNEGYNDPKFQQYSLDASVAPIDGGKLMLTPGEGLEWACTWQNNSQTTFTFGPNTQTNEHCNLFGFYYPTDAPQEGIECIHLTRSPDVNVRCGSDGVACPPNPPSPPAS